MQRRSLQVLPGEIRPQPRAEVEDVLREIAIHVRRREELRRRGASEQELESYREQISRLQWRLAHAARRNATEEGPWAA